MPFCTADLAFEYTSSRACEKVLNTNQIKYDLLMKYDVGNVDV